MVRYKREIELRAEPSIDAAEDFRTAGVVHYEITGKEECYLFGNLEVNAGFQDDYKLPYEQRQQETKRKEAGFSTAIIKAEDTFIRTFSSDESQQGYYELDLSPILPEGWTVHTAVSRGLDIRHIGFIAVSPDASEETFREIEGIHVLNNDDFRKSGEKICGSLMKSWYQRETGEIACHREAGHSGVHQAISGPMIHNWELPTGGSASWGHPYGFAAKCPYCGEVDGGPVSGTKVCFSCNYWLEQKKSPSNAFIIEGAHYRSDRAGHGGFGNAVFKIERFNGTKYTGELWHQGDIPEWFREEMPDNAKFVEKYLPRTTPH